MHKSVAILASTAILAAVVLAQIPPAPIELVWEGMFAPPYLTNPQIALAMDCASPDSCYLAGGSNGVGFGIFKYDGKMNGLVTKMQMPNMSMIAMDLAVGKTAAGAETGVFTSITEFGISKAVQYLKGQEWLPSAIPLELIWAGESVTGSPDGQTYVAVGSGLSLGGPQNGFLVSKDGGLVFENLAFNYKDDATNCSFPGYIDISSPNAWYLTYGNEPPQNNSNNKYLKADEIVIGKKASGKVLNIYNKKTGEIRQHVKTWKELYADRAEAKMKAVKDNNQCNFYLGEILKSTDQGKTWKRQFKMEGMTTSYVVCGDATHCTVTGFNEGYSYTITTVDGENWKITYTSPPPTQTSAVGIQAVGYASTTEVWAAGSHESQAGGYGMFWSSNNGGESWTPYKHTVPDVMAVMAVDFTQGTGFAIGLTMFKTAQIMRYKKQADYGDFIQSHCPIKGCSILCQNISFPQGMCLPAQGGSAKAFCTPDGVKQYMFETTSCVGSYKTAMQPINQCLNGTNTFFENYCPPANTNSKARAATPRDLLQF